METTGGPRGPRGLGPRHREACPHDHTGHGPHRPGGDAPVGSPSSPGGKSAPRGGSSHPHVLTFEALDLNQAMAPSRYITPEFVLHYCYMIAI